MSVIRTEDQKEINKILDGVTSLIHQAYMLGRIAGVHQATEVLNLSEKADEKKVEEMA